MREITATNHIERESCGTLLAILHLNFYVWSFYAFLLDISTHTNSILVSSPFIGGRLLSQVFAPPQLGASTTTHLSILACIGKVLACCFYQEHKRLPNVQLFIQSLLWTSSRNSFSPCTYCLITVPHWILRVLLHNLRVLSCNFCSPDFSLFFAFMFDSSSSCHNTCPSQNRVSIFIPLLYFSSIIRVFNNFTLKKLQSPNLTSLEKSQLHQILEHTEPNCSFMLSSC